MQTSAQLKTEVYDALNGNSTITNYVKSIDWLGSNQGQTIPFLTYSMLDEIGGYVMGLSFNHSEVFFQIELYVNGGGETVNVDPVKQAIMDEMHTLNYRMQGSPEQFNSDTDSNVIVYRWVRHNV